MAIKLIIIFFFIICLITAVNVILRKSGHTVVVSRVFRFFLFIFIPVAAAHRSDPFKLAYF